ncbi:MAG TPA: prepilin-type N-terminal cleavage/methylation domain-containing protein [Sedimentisphaerales bacterium]|nr:prepilin-type N-terminal cleavage/methylation domain-containing protein [Sedimentisphaerales bacterium]
MKEKFCKRGVSVSKAFTLVEVLVVISIIALLMGILMPALNRARASAASTACQANLRSIAYGFVMYLDDNRDIMPPAVIMPIEGFDSPTIMDFLMRYLSEPKVFKCPSDVKDHYYDDYGTSYGYNAMLGGTTVDKSMFAKMTRSKAVNIHVMRDLTPFHGKEGKPGSCNYLYADGHVSDNREQH